MSFGHVRIDEVVESMNHHTSLVCCFDKQKLACKEQSSKVDFSPDVCIKSSCRTQFTAGTRSCTAWHVVVDADRAAGYDVLSRPSFLVVVVGR